jgi:hypothetical protein
MGTKTNPDLIGVGHRELRVSMAGLPPDQWARLAKVAVYVTKPSGAASRTEVLKAGLTVDKIALVPVLFGTAGLYSVAVNLQWTNSEWLAQPESKWDYLQASGITEG